MVTMYKTVRWEFNGDAFAFAVSEWVLAFGADEVAAMLHVHRSTVQHWSRGVFNVEFPHPSMSNLLTVCNELNINPTLMFTTSED